MSEQAKQATREFGKRAALMSVAIGCTGLFTYGFFALAAHSLSKAEYGSITILWAAVMISAAVLYRPVEQMLSRTIAERLAIGHVGSRPLKVAAFIQLFLGLLFLTVALLLRSTIETKLFGGDQTLYLIMVISILAYAVSFFARGFLAGQHLLGIYGVLVFFESVIRFTFALVVTIGFVKSTSVIAWGIAAAPIISLIVLPKALGDRARHLVSHGSDDAKAEAGEFSFSHGAGFAGAVVVIMLSEQTFINGGPLIVNATEGAQGAALAGFVFNILLVARAPLQLYQAIATSLLPHLTKMRVTHGRLSFHHSIKVTLLTVTAFSVAVTAVMLIAGPQLMQLFFSSKFSYDRLGLVTISIGMGLYLAAATLNQAALAQGQTRRAAYCWALSAVVFIGWMFSGITDSVGRRVEWGFLISAVLLSGLLYLLYRIAPEHPEDMPVEGSPEEVETFLAAADEAS